MGGWGVSAKHSPSLCSPLLNHPNRVVTVTPSSTRSLGAEGWEPGAEEAGRTPPHTDWMPEALGSRCMEVAG